MSNCVQMLPTGYKHDWSSDEGGGCDGGRNDVRYDPVADGVHEDAGRRGDGPVQEPKVGHVQALVQSLAWVHLTHFWAKGELEAKL